MLEAMTSNKQYAEVEDPLKKALQFIRYPGHCLKDGPRLLALLTNLLYPDLRYLHIMHWYWPWPKCCPMEHNDPEIWDDCEVAFMKKHLKRNLCLFDGRSSPRFFFCIPVLHFVPHLIIKTFSIWKWLIYWSSRSINWISISTQDCGTDRSKRKSNKKRQGEGVEGHTEQKAFLRTVWRTLTK